MNNGWTIRTNQDVKLIHDNQTNIVTLEFEKYEELPYGNIGDKYTDSITISDEQFEKLAALVASLILEKFVHNNMYENFKQEESN